MKTVTWNSLIDSTAPFFLTNKMYNILFLSINIKTMLFTKKTRS